MSDLRQLINELSKREITRRQFLLLVSGSFLGMIGFFRILQSLNTPDMTTSDRGAFGEKEYGYPDSSVIAAVKKKGFSEDTFG